MNAKDIGNATGLEIAVIGMVCRFPKAKNIDEFWKKLVEGEECITFFTDEELKEAGVSPKLLENPRYVKAYGWIEGIEFFDASFFGYTPLEAETMDPQMRLFHESALDVLESAGYDSHSYEKLIGLYAGALSSIYWQIRALLSGNTKILGDFPARQYHDKDFMVTRVANKLNLKGPAVIMNAACSTSLIAVHLACQALLSGDCDMALAGGVSIPVLSKGGYWYEEGMIFSADGHTRTFDAGAKGFNTGNGIGIVVLKRLEEAIADRDTIHAVIKGTAVNNDGSRKAAYAAPSIDGQSEVIRTAQNIAEVEPETIGYVEAHGTGTALGDPVEIEGLKSAFHTGKKQFCRIGSVKTNMGHLEVAAGIAGFIKTVLILKHRLIPPSLFYTKPNPKIDFENSPFVVNDDLTEWKSRGNPLRAGVSSFGIGGTNAHAVLEEWHEDEKKTSEEKDKKYKLIVLSAKTQSALERMTENLADYLKRNPGINITDAAYTLQQGRRRYPYRRMLVCAGRDEAVDILSVPDAKSGKIKTYCSDQDNRPIVFMFPGLGSQYVNMGRDLYEREPGFRNEIDRCFEILNGLLKYEIKGILYPSLVSDGSSKSHMFDIGRPEVAQVVIFIFEYALAKLLMEWGIKPKAMIGYSLGEYAAACTAGVFSLEEALELVVFRGRMLRDVPSGAMLSVPLPAKEVEPLLHSGLSIGIDNGPSCVVSGASEAIDTFEKQMKERKLMCMRVDTSRALHSQMMEPVGKKFREKVGGFSLKKPEIPYISNVTGEWIRDEEAVDPGYWGRHLRQTVRFAQGMEEMLKRTNSLLIEIGPGRDISTLALRYLNDGEEYRVLNLVRHPQQNIPDDYFLLRQIGKLWLYGQRINWTEWYGEGQGRRIPLPTYPFEHRRFWIDKNASKFGAEGILAESPARRKPDKADWFHIPSWKRSRRFASKTGKKDVRLNWLVFTDACGFGERLVQHLAKEEQHAVEVRTGTGFGVVDEGVYTVNPCEDNDYDELFQELCRIGRIPDRIVHLWSITGDAEAPGELNLDIEYVDNVQNSGFYSLISIVQAIGRQDIDRKIRMAVVTAGMQQVNGADKGFPARATVLGPVKVIPREFGNIGCKSIDLVLPAPGSLEEQELAADLFREMVGESPDTERVIAFRDGFRWVESFEAVQLETSEEKELPLREKGVYLITGGLGGIGLALAKHLAKRIHAKLVLTGRTSIPSREEWDRWLAEHEKEDDLGLKIRHVQELEQMGAEVMAVSVDVADQTRMGELLDRVKQRFGRLNGVIHAAGLADGAVIARRTREMSQRIFASKITGTLVLDRLLRDIELDFFVFCSSVASIAPASGQVGYSAANAFQDAFSDFKASGDRVFTVSINWDRWQNVGISVIAEQLHKRLTGEELEGGITPEEGVDIFDRILGDMLPRVAVSPYPLTRLRRQARTSGAPPKMEKIEEISLAKSTHERPELDSEYVAPRSELQQKLVDIWSKFFGFETLGIRDDFIELGGDSLKAISMISRIHRELSVAVPLVQFFNNPTVEKLAQYIDHAEKDIYSRILPVEEKEYYALSSAQKRLFILQHLAPESTAYNEFMAIPIEGELEKDVLTASFKQLIARHESLRTSFMLLKDEPVQQVKSQVAFEIESYDTSGARSGKGGVEAIIKNFVRPFELSLPPLFRVGLITRAVDNCILLIDTHHLITDGRSLDIFINELVDLVEGKVLPALNLRYKDFSRWQSRFFQEEESKLNRQKEYWIKKFEDRVPLLDLPFNYPRPQVQTFEGKQINFELGRSETKDLKDLASKEDVTLFMLLLGIYSIFLSKLSGQEDIVIGSPIAGRNHPDLQSIIGMFVNMLALRNFPSGEKSFLRFLKEVKEITVESLENQDYQFEELVEQLGISRDAGRNPLFTVTFAMLNTGSPQAREPEKLGVKKYTIEQRMSKFDLGLEALDVDEKIILTFLYSTKLFKKETVERFTHYFKEIVSIVVRDKSTRLRDIAIDCNLSELEEVVPEMEFKF